MKKYLLFAGDYYYPAGGFNDFIGSFDSIDEAKQAYANCDWVHIVDSETEKIIARMTRSWINNKNIITWI